MDNAQSVVSLQAIKGTTDLHDGVPAASADCMMTFWTQQTDELQFCIPPAPASALLVMYIGTTQPGKPTARALGCVGF